MSDHELVATTISPANGVQVTSERIPLNAALARPIILGLFAAKSPWKVDDLQAEVERIHLSRGGLRGVAPLVRIIRQALMKLREDGLAINVTTGYWRGKNGVAANAEPTAIEGSGETAIPIDGPEDNEQIVIEKRIGEGPEVIYLYFNPNDRELATTKGRDVWECKIGRTSGDAVIRILGQGAATALSHPPVVGLIIRTSDSSGLEKAMHALLRLTDCEVPDSLGTEWFFTSPLRIEAWHSAYMETLKHLASPVAQDS